MKVHGLHHRIKFVRLVFQVLISIRQNERTVIVYDVPRLLNTSMELLTVIQETVAIGDVCKSGDEPKFLGFEPSINQRLLPPTFPRYTKIKSRLEAYAYFVEMIERFKSVHKVASINSLHQALDYFIEFSKSSPCILSRSALYLQYPGIIEAIILFVLK